jgi:hypothetical protein
VVDCFGRVVDLKTIHSLRIVTFEERDNGPLVLIVNTDDVLVRDQDLLDLPALNILRVELLHLLSHVLVHTILVDI